METGIRFYELGFRLKAISKENVICLYCFAEDMFEATETFQAELDLNAQMRNTIIGNHDGLQNNGFASVSCILVLFGSGTRIKGSKLKKRFINFGYLKIRRTKKLRVVLKICIVLKSVSNVR